MLITATLIKPDRLDSSVCSHLMTPFGFRKLFRKTNQSSTMAQSL